MTTFGRSAAARPGTSCRIGPTGFIITAPGRFVMEQASAEPGRLRPRVHHAAAKSAASGCSANVVENSASMDAQDRAAAPGL